MLSIENVYFKYPKRASSAEPSWVLADISFKVQPGEFISIIGRSGCGKSTLLALLAGLITPTQGKILEKNIPVLCPSGKRVLIFQGHALFPWKTATGNIEFVLRARGVPRQKRRELAMTYLKKVNLIDYANAYPHELSGGMQQRIGIARALAAEPDVLLLDEPFSSLDLHTRREIIDELKSIAGQMKKTVILVTHNLDEAFYIGQRVYVMSSDPGQIVDEIDLPASKPELLSSLHALPAYLEFRSRISDLMQGDPLKGTSE